MFQTFAKLLVPFPWFYRIIFGSGQVPLFPQKKLWKPIARFATFSHAQRENRTGNFGAENWGGNQSARGRFFFLRGKENLARFCCSKVLTSWSVALTVEICFKLFQDKSEVPHRSWKRTEIIKSANPPLFYSTSKPHICPFPVKKEGEKKEFRASCRDRWKKSLLIIISAARKGGLGKTCVVWEILIVFPDFWRKFPHTTHRGLHLVGNFFLAFFLGGKKIWGIGMSQFPIVGWGL